MDYDVLIIGAGMSGLAAGIRVAQYDHRVLIVERHNVYGGLNSFYTIDGRAYDVGLHALTNYTPPGVRQAPLAKLLRQLRIPREVLDLQEQRYSAVRFPGRELRFTNDIDMLTAEVRREFPAEIDGFCRLIADVRAYDDLRLDAAPQSARQQLGAYLSDAVLVDMLLCPVMYYGSAIEDDIDWTQFVTMCKSLFLEGFARPRQGVRRIVAELVKRYRGCGGEFSMGCGVTALESDGRRVTAVQLDDGRVVTAGTILSSAGAVETQRLLGQSPPDTAVGRLSFVESISIVPDRPRDFGLDATIVFFNDAERFAYRRPDELIDPTSGVICCPNNYEGHDHLQEGIVRVTSLANHPRWTALAEPQYSAAKEASYHASVDIAERYVPAFRHRVTVRDVFTPRTIQKFTGHLGGAVYGAPNKSRDGRTAWDNLFLCGTDQGFLGIIGACLSGISMANLHVLAGPSGST